MKRLYIVVEGQTEQEFIKELIAPYFCELEFYDVRPFLIRTSRTGRGGFVNYQHLKNDITKLLKHETNIIVTTFVDFFRIPTNIPEYDKCNNQNANVYDKVNCFENAIGNDIMDRRFIPYIQLHEFEALLFSSNKGFSLYYDQEVCELTQSIIQQYPNPELINNRPETAPSKRLLSIIPNYEKVLHGNLIAIEIGIPTIIEKCVRFRKWIDDITERLKE